MTARDEVPFALMEVRLQFQMAKHSFTAIVDALHSQLALPTEHLKQIIEVKDYDTMSLETLAIELEKLLKNEKIK